MILRARVTVLNSQEVGELREVLLEKFLGALPF